MRKGKIIALLLFTALALTPVASARASQGNLTPLEKILCRIFPRLPLCQPLPPPPPPEPEPEPTPEPAAFVPSGFRIPTRAELSTPKGGETYLAGERVLVIFGAEGRATSGTRISSSTNSGETYEDVHDDVFGPSGWYWWTVPNTPTEHGRLKLEVLDAAGVMASAESGEFTISATESEVTE